MVGGAGVLVVTGLMMLLGAPSVLARAPEWPSPPNVLVVHSTRVILRIVLRSEKLATKWKAEYAPMECGGPVPTEGWKIVNEQEISAESAQFNELLLGAPDTAVEGASAPVQLRGLEPGTCYEVRFSATNADSGLNGKGEVEPSVRLVSFKTLPIEPPEVPKEGNVEESLGPIFRLEDVTDVGVMASAKIESNGADTEYGFEYSLPENGHAPSQGSGSWELFSSGGTGTVTAVADFAKVTAGTTGLSPETTYYVRIRMSNEKGTVYQTKYFWDGGYLEEFVTGTAGAGVASVVVRNVTGVSAHLSGGVFPRGSGTAWRFESAPVVSGVCPSGSGGVWSVIPGGEGVVGQVQAEVTPYSFQVLVGVGFTGLSASSVYCVRLSVENGFGSDVSGVASFETEGPPAVSTFSVHRLVGESLELLGTVNPKSVATSEEQLVSVGGATGGSFTLSFGGHTTVPIAYNATAGSVEGALRGLVGEPPVEVQGVAGGPYTVLFGGGDVGLAEPLIGADGTGLTPSPGSDVTVTRVQQGGESNDTQYWFQYVTEKSFEEHGWSSPEETEHAPGGFGDTPHLVGVVVPGLQSGVGYRFRLIAESTLSGSSPVVGGEESLTVPVTPVVGVGGVCPNEVFRVGLSAGLSDCRVYEQVTPVEKGGAQEPFHYRGGIASALLVGGDGGHAVLEAPAVSYGSGTGSGQSPYLFSRGEDGWLMTAGAPQPEMGVNSVTPQVYSGDLTQMAFESAYSPSQLSKSPEVAYEIGRVGGPYKTVASVPRSVIEVGEPTGWVAANGDLSKVVLETGDHELLGGETGTSSGSDLYEYTVGGGLRQLNVMGSENVTIGSCGARMVHGQEDGEGSHVASGSRSVSVDGSRVFFEAVPGKACSAVKHLYMRVDSASGRETVDIGPYAFVAASPRGMMLLLRNGSGELVGYDTGAKTFESQPSGGLAEGGEMSFLGIPVRFEPNDGDAFARSRYTFWTPPAGIGGQASRYDDVEHVMECISCASSSSGVEPGQDAFLGDVEGLPEVNGGLPNFTAVSGNGDFAFFTTVAALVSQDVDQEVPAEYNALEGVYKGEFINVGGHTSPSTDVYEWRAGGVDDCGVVRGCLSLITDGRGGYLNLFLGSANEGRDVFFYSRSTLSSGGHAVEGTLGEGNVYDARIGGGFAGPPPRRVECEGDACSSPPSAPVDSTPSSFTFSGMGNVINEPSKKPVKKKKTKKKIKKKKGRKKGRGRAKGAGGRRAGVVGRGGVRGSGVGR
jgi:hypothetical protein